MRSPRFLPAPLRLTAALIAVQTVITTPVLADVPANWIKSSPDAYVLSPGSFNIEGSLQRVNDTIDFLNFRDDLQEINARLVGDSGDLEGSGINLRVGVWRGLELFYQRQQQELMLEVSPSSRTNIVDLDRSLDTERTEYGLNWVLYEENNRRSNSPWRSIALELSRAEGNSDEFGGGAADFFHYHHMGHITHAGTTEFIGNSNAQQSQVAHFAPEIHGKFIVLIDNSGAGSYFFGCKLPDLMPQHRNGLVQLKIWLGVNGQGAGHGIGPEQLFYCLGPILNQL